MASEGQGGGWWPEGKKGEPPTPEPAREGESKPPRGLASGGRSKPPSRYSLFVGIAFFALILVAMFNLIGNDDAGILGAGSGGEGEPLIEFAVPDALGAEAGDANVFQDDCESALNPCPTDQVRTPACEIETADAIRVCDYFDLPLAISFWFTRGGDCTPTQNAFNEVASRYEGKANFLSINVRDDRETVKEIVEAGGWTVPVGLDSDGAVSNLYRVGACPTIALAYPGGILRAVEAFEPFDEEEITGFVDELIDASAKRQATSR